MRVGKPDGHVTGQEKEDLAAGFGARLKELRLAAGLSSGRLAESAGVARTTVHWLENGDRRPGEGTLAALAAILSPQNPETAAEELTALAGESMRKGWSSRQPTADRIPTVAQARKALRRAVAIRDSARRMVRVRPSSAATAFLERAELVVMNAKRDVDLAEHYAESGPGEV